MTDLGDAGVVIHAELLRASGVADSGVFLREGTGAPERASARSGVLVPGEAHRFLGVESARPPNVFLDVMGAVVFIRLLETADWEIPAGENIGLGVEENWGLLIIPEPEGMEVARVAAACRVVGFTKTPGPDGAAESSVGAEAGAEIGAGVLAPVCMLLMRGSGAGACLIAACAVLASWAPEDR